jgi:lipopolysaccharide/colanic/teichoic acid biosynthesis glycosyltransferase
MKTRIASRWILVADVLWFVAAFLVAALLRYHRIWSSENRAALYALSPFLITGIISWVVLSSWMKLDCFSGGWRPQALVSQVFLAVFCVVSFLLGLGYLAREYVSRLALTYVGILLFIGLVVIRYIARSLLVARYRAGIVRRVVIAGTDRISREIGAKIKRHPEMACEVVGFLCPDDIGVGSSSDFGDALTVSTIGIIDLLRNERVTDLILAMPAPALPEIINLAGRCRQSGIDISFVPQPYELYLSKPTLLDLDGIPILELRDPEASRGFLVLKRATDVALGSVLAIIAAPIVLLSVLGLRRRKSQVFCSEERCGQAGKLFRMIRLNVDRSEDAVLTHFEQVLITLSLTELPQLWNVLKGEMSLVGPRPDLPERVDRYTEWERERLRVKPGMTGLAQVHGLRDHNTSEERTRFDLQYMLNPSAVADASILLQTLWTLSGRLPPFSKRILAGPHVDRSHAVDDINSQFLEDTLRDAHRSQSSAD